jgi:hypothetical protein
MDHISQLIDESISAIDDVFIEVCDPEKSINGCFFAPRNVFPRYLLEGKAYSIVHMGEAVFARVLDYSDEVVLAEV